MFIVEWTDHEGDLQRRTLNTLEDVLLAVRLQNSRHLGFWKRLGRRKSTLSYNVPILTLPDDYFCARRIIAAV